MEGQKPREAEAYAANYNAHRPGITLQESTQVYDQWTTYEKDLGPDHYRGPVIAAAAVADFYDIKREKPLITDVACGTGFVGEELWKLGFRRMHSLDPSSKLLEMAHQKQIYQEKFCCYLDHNCLPIDDHIYNCAVIAGGMGEGPIPCAGLYELAGIVKPGGLVCIVMQEEYLKHVAQYRGQLESIMNKMEASGTWNMESKTVVPKYSFDNTGVVYKFVVC